MSVLVFLCFSSFLSLGFGAVCTVQDCALWENELVVRFRSKCEDATSCETEIASQLKELVPIDETTRYAELAGRASRLRTQCFRDVLFTLQQNRVFVVDGFNLTSFSEKDLVGHFPFACSNLIEYRMALLDAESVPGDDGLLRQQQFNLSLPESQRDSACVRRASTLSREVRHLQRLLSTCGSLAPCTSALQTVVFQKMVALRLEVASQTNMVPLFYVATFSPFDYFGSIFLSRECVGSSEPFEMCYFNELLPKWTNAVTSESFNQSALDLQVTALEPTNSSTVFFQYVYERRLNPTCLGRNCSTMGGDVEDMLSNLVSTTLQVSPCTSYYLTSENIAALSSTTCWMSCRYSFLLKLAARVASSKRRFAKISYLMTLGRFCSGFNSTCVQSVKSMVLDLWNDADITKVSRFRPGTMMSSPPPDPLLVVIGISLSGLSLIGCVLLVIFGWNALKNSDQNVPLIICICSLFLWSLLRMIWWIIGVLPQNISFRLDLSLKTIFYAVNFMHIFFWTEGVVFILLSIIVLIMLNSWIDALSSFSDNFPESILKFKRVFLIVVFLLYVCFVIGGLIAVSVELSQPYSTQIGMGDPTRAFVSLFFVVVSSFLVFFSFVLTVSSAIGLYFISAQLKRQNIPSKALWGVLRLSVIFFLIFCASVLRLVSWVYQIDSLAFNFSIAPQSVLYYVNYSLVEACFLAAMFTFAILAIHSFSSSASVNKFQSKPIELNEPLLSGNKYSDF